MRPSRARATRPATAGGPIRLVDVELARPLPDLEAIGGYARAHVLVRLHGRPLGTVSLQLDGGALDAGLLAVAIWDSLADRIVSHCRADHLALPGHLTAGGLVHPGESLCSWRRSLAGHPMPFATIVITTCGGVQGGLAATVRSALAQTYPCFEVTVVDNRPATSGVRQILNAGFPSEERLRYVAEPRPGLSHARNCGAAAGRGDLLAFTDDDVALDPEWLGCLVAGFEHPRVACVTGLILPLELETRSQRLLEEFGGYAKGFDPRTWDCDEHRPDDPLYPYTVGVFGSGASAAFRRDVFAEIGGFDGALGAGTRSRGGEDIDIYVTCVQRGFQIQYEPGAILRHAHMREIEQVHQKVRDYGVGLGAMLTKHFFRDWRTFAGLAARAPSGLRRLLGPDSAKNAARTATYPSSLVIAELAGLLYGPIAYLRSRLSE